MARFDEDSGLLCLEGSPAEVGAAFGAANAEDIRSEVAAFFGGGRERESLLRATARYREIIARHAPHWLEEAAAMAGAAGVDPDDYTAYLGAKYRGINRPECFTYFSAPVHNRDGVTLFHKNRDNRDRPQAAYVKALRVGGKAVQRYAATGDTSDTGTMMGVNEKGLAAAADTGAPDPHPRYRGVMNPDLMRLILEQAGDVADAEEMIRGFQADGTYAGGNIATNWMFADRSGRAVRIVQFHESLEKSEDEGGLMTMRADERGRLVLETMNEERGWITPRTLNRLSRTPPVLAKTNLSAMTASIPSSEAGLFGYAEFAVCHAGRTVYVPIYIGARATPRVLADGTLYRLSREQPESLGAGAAAFEEGQEADRREIEASARATFLREGVDAARQSLTEGGLRLAERAAEYLRSKGCPGSLSEAGT